MKIRIKIISLIMIFTASCNTRSFNTEQSHNNSTGSQVAKDDEFSSSLAFDHGRFCSGTKVAPKFILTAAHCVVFLGRKTKEDRIFKIDEGSNIKVSNKVKFLDSSSQRSYTIRKLHIQEKLRNDIYNCTNGDCWVHTSANSKIPSNPDVALIEVTEVLAGIPSAKLPEDDIKIGDQLFGVGYGVHSSMLNSTNPDFQSASNSGDNKVKRWFFGYFEDIKKIVDMKGMNLEQKWKDDINSMNEANKEFAIHIPSVFRNNERLSSQSGDSGGGLFHSGDKQVIVGVLSSTWTKDEGGVDYPIFSTGVRITNTKNFYTLDWIKETISKD